MSTIQLTDWREKAAAAAEGNVADDMAVEKAFMDQAYAAVQNKCGPLMRSPHQIGFEIVHKNDAATRMVGIFGFRAGRQLFYAPVFFLSGEIKGTDLLYRHLTKTFVPLNEEWVVYLIEGAKSEMGRGIDKTEANQYPVRMDMEMLAYPPMTGHNYFHKGAAINADELLGKEAAVVEEESEWNEEAIKAAKDQLHKDWEELFDKMEKPAALERQDIKGAVLEIGMPAVEKLASMIEESLTFATELTRNIPQEDWMPAELHEVKKEAAEEEPQPDPRVLAIGRIGNTPEFAKFGFEMVDQRESKEVNTVYENDGETLQRASDPGKWDLVMSDGSLAEALVFNEDNGYGVGREVGSNDPENGSAYPCAYDDPSNQRMVVVMAKDKCSSTPKAKTIHGEMKDLFKEIVDDLPKEMTSKKGYRVVDPESAVASCPFVVVSKKDRDGVTEYRIRTSGYGNERILTVNPDCPRNDFRSGAFNEDIRFVEVKVDEYKKHPRYDDEYVLTFDESVMLGNEDTVDAWLRTTAPIKKASLKEDPETGMIELQYGAQIARMSTKMAAAGVLAADLHIDRDTTFQLLDDLTAENNHRRDFTVWEKNAAQLQLIDDAQFQTYTDDDFGITVDPAQQFRLRTMYDGPTPPPPRLGDAWDPAMGQEKVNEGLGDDQLLNMDPNQIAEMSQQGDTPAVFDHGVIGSLVHTFDANALVESYLPKLEDAVDALGRTLFLFYWKPSDFEISYGADDMMQLENQFTSNFKSLGTVLLELLKRSRQKDHRNESSERG